MRNAIVARAPFHASGAVARPRRRASQLVKYATKVADMARATTTQIVHFAALIASLRPLHGAASSFRCFSGPPSRKASMGRKRNSR